MSSGNEEAQLAQCQAYVRRHNIQQLVKDAIVSLCINKPDNPVLFLREHFDKIYEQRSQGTATDQLGKLALGRIGQLEMSSRGCSRNPQLFLLSFIIKPLQKNAPSRAFLLLPGNGCVFVDSFLRKRTLSLPWRSAQKTEPRASPHHNI
ncbi:regulatory subunit of type II PKA r-subunit domain-containing protein [Ditylenchus destructor]|nr:regulatory subunit of type II PKA r-subunit domain-containing protein [Ditylenchus destructor]